MGGQAKHGLWKSNIKIEKYLAGGRWGGFHIPFGPKSLKTGLD